MALYFAGSRALMMIPFGALSELAFAAPVLVFAGCGFVLDYLRRHPEFSDLVR